MAEPKIYSRTQLKEYILAHLGAPVVNIEITDQQLELCIDDTLDEYLPVAYSGVVERYFPVQIIPGIQDYILPYDVFAILEILGPQTMGMGSTLSSQPFSLGQFIAADLFQNNVGHINLTGYELINEMLSTIELMFSQKITFDFNSISKILHLYQVPTEPRIVIHAYKKLDIEGTIAVSGASGVRYVEENIYSERWIKRMATAKAQLQWGKNLLKFSGSTLPNGGQLNAEFIYNEAKETIERMNESLINDYAIPYDFFIG